MASDEELINNHLYRFKNGCQAIFVGFNLLSERKPIFHPTGLNGAKYRYLGCTEDVVEDLGLAIEYQPYPPQLKLWEILVPTMRNDGRPFRLRYHKVWDAKVLAITGGLTITHPTKGEWVSKHGTLFKDRMIPVRVMCTKEQIDQIIDMTGPYYEQEAIMFYMVSNDVEIRYFKNDNHEKAKSLSLHKAFQKEALLRNA